MSPLLHKVVQCFERFAPLALADMSWDNVGVLIESPSAPVAAASETAAASPPTEERLPGTVFLTIDLTEPVLAEAIASKASVIVAYHPVLFAPFKRMVQSDPKGRIITQCVLHGISVYCPHTSLDACENGMNDWLVDIFQPAVVGGGPKARIPRRPIQPISAATPGVVPQVPETRGFGRVFELPAPMSLSEAVHRVKSATGLSVVRLATPERSRGQPLEDMSIRSIAVCAGSGAGVFKKLLHSTASGSAAPDLFLTGEMGHHDVLAAVGRGSAVILCEHTNTERGFLRSVVPSWLKETGANIVVSTLDRDPLAFC